MNEILQNLINIENVVSFIDDVIVRTKEEEGYNKVVKKVVEKVKKLLMENDLYMKPEKSK